MIIAPAVILLVEIVPLLVPVPCLDAWSFVQQYQHLVEDRYSWEAFFAPHYVHPSTVGKVIYFAVLHCLGGNVAVLPILSWLFSALIAFSVYKLARPLWPCGGEHQGRSRLNATVLLTCVTSVIFTAAQGEVWIWDFVFQNFIPGTCLALGILLLHREGHLRFRCLMLASVLSLLAICSFGTGFFVPAFLGLILVWRLRGVGESWSKTGTLVGGWWLVHGVVAWLALTASGGEDSGLDAGTLFERPLMRLQFVLIVLGNILGKGTTFEPEVLCAITGAALLTAFLTSLIYLWRHRDERPLVQAAFPWIIFSLYGLSSAVLISLGRMHNSLDNALDERFATFDVFFVFGALLLLAIVIRHSGLNHPAYSRAMAVLPPAAMTLFVALLAVNWANGHNLMKVKYSRMNQERALLMFAKVMPLNEEWMDARVTRKSAFRLASFLSDRGRLHDVVFAADRNIKSFQQGREMGGKWARLDPPVPLEEGGWRLSGLGGLAVDNAADLILVTAQPANGSGNEQIVALTAPQLQQHFYDRAKLVRMHPENYLGWQQTLHDEMLPSGPVTLRAYVLDQDKRIVHPLKGVYRLERDHPHAVSEG
ncbi:hypothetical protein [Verrucomicrobium spinosum]|uniref:hypothetical protein n=1 Tax=Verrucomicrobium spinosum TaxID=2736 RepID=UPI00017460D0|nr:hypothetical protein [Verrucomicrobium spinosum]